mmetsp:Transcript_4966/g.18467  ORF Transcript_4966/g.18467 Transcript_4966/m.18467 type:complete len:208 (-) Transcript_4966:175-798(-)
MSYIRRRSTPSFAAAVSREISSSCPAPYRWRKFSHRRPRLLSFLLYVTALSPVTPGVGPRDAGSSMGAIAEDAPLFGAKVGPPNTLWCPPNPPPDMPWCMNPKNCRANAAVTAGSFVVPGGIDPRPGGAFATTAGRPGTGLVMSAGGANALLGAAAGPVCPGAVGAVNAAPGAPTVGGRISDVSRDGRHPPRTPCAPSPFQPSSRWS